MALGRISRSVGKVPACLWAPSTEPWYWQNRIVCGLLNSSSPDESLKVEGMEGRGPNGVSRSCPSSGAVMGLGGCLLTAVMPSTVLQCEMPFGVFSKYKVNFIK